MEKAKYERIYKSLDFFNI